MELKNDCQVDYIKEAFDKLYNSVMPFVDLTQFADANAAFKDLDKKVHSEIYILKKCLATLADINCRLASENVDLKAKVSDLEKENERLRGVIDGLEKKNADDEIRIKSLERANSVLRRDNGILWSKMEELEIGKRPWHGDANAMTGAQTCCESLVEAIEFQNKKIEELEA